MDRWTALCTRSCTHVICWDLAACGSAWRRIYARVPCILLQSIEELSLAGYMHVVMKETGAERSPRQHVATGADPT